MKLTSPQEEFYATERLSAIEAQRLAQEIAFGPIVFQVSRLMLKFDIFQLLLDHKDGLTMKDIVEKTTLSQYAVQILLESSLTIGTILLKKGKFFLAKAGYFLLKDVMAKVNIDFNHDVNYLGLFNLEEALLQGTPEGLKVFGNWATIYEGLSKLPPQVQQSWFAFDHYYSDCSFPQALEVVFQHNVNTLLDVGGNTGRFALRCVEYDENVNVTIMDLPAQLKLMKKSIEGKIGANRIDGFGIDFLNPHSDFPKRNVDAIWMSQFLDCFSNEEVTSILSRAKASMNEHTKLYIMETIWDRQRFETASFCLTQISVYFTALANGNSKMFYSEDLKECIAHAGLQIETIHDNIGLGHSIVVCKKQQ